MKDSQTITRDLFVVLGNQLFAFAHYKPYRNATFFMAEDMGLCTYVKHHKLKLVLFLAAMRSFADDLHNQGCDVHYSRLDDQYGAGLRTLYETKLERFIQSRRFDRLVMFEIEDKFFERRIIDFAQQHDLQLVFVRSPMFVTSRTQFAAYLSDANQRPYMARFYEQQRKRLNILVNDQGKPSGGQWSFDADNREKLPEMQPLPDVRYPQPTDHVHAVQQLVDERFADHPGDASSLWLPTTRAQALTWLRHFLSDRFADFGPYEDALSNRADVLFHSVLTPMLNLGLITPDEVIERAVQHADEHEIPLNSLEGFVRQIIGWREFMRGIYQTYSDKQERTNFWKHKREMKPCWYDGTTGIPPLDDAIRKALRLGWTHHIERLMVLANLMNLCEIKPKQVHDWFMEMFIDSSDWVMGPNVYGMGLMSDGGIFATKPYIAGSNYLRKMSDSTTAQKGDWCDVVDGLYWRFIDNHRDFFSGNPRLSMMLGTLDKMKPERRHSLMTKAGRFISEVTTSSS